MPKSGATLMLSLGRTDMRPTDWDGEISVAPGTVVALESERARIEGSRWSVRTQPAPARAKAKAKAKEAGRIEPVLVFATLDASDQAEVSINTRQGKFSFRLGDLVLGRPVDYLDGSIAVERIPVTRRIAAAEGEDDFPAAAVATDGTVWCAFVHYKHGQAVAMEEVAKGRFDSLKTRGNGDQVRLLRFADDQWSPPIDVTEAGLDIWRPAVAIDGRGRVWVIWSQNVEGNWDLYARRYDPQAKSWGDRRRLTSDPGADFHVVAAYSEKAGIVLAWQGWRQDNFDILLATLEDEGPLKERRVSMSRANDWSPAIAASPQGDIWVAWDTYDQGNYDVFARRATRDGLDEPVAVAISPRFEARPSIALDAKGRLWIAFEDAYANWGKDYGSRIPWKQALPLYFERMILVRCIEDGRVRAAKEQRITSELLNTHFDDTKHPMERYYRVSVPRLALDIRGNLWLLFRRHPSTTAEQERWISFATRYEGDHWTEPIPLRQALNTLDNRPALAALKDKGLLAIFSTDYRPSGAASIKENDLYASRLDAEGPPPEPQLVAVDPKGDGTPVELIHPDEAADIARLRSHRIQVGDKTYRLLRGDFHRHTEWSGHRDWDGLLEDAWRYALDVAAMDWFGPTDHEYAMVHEYPWWLSQKQADLYHHAPHFVPMFTYERSLPYPSGHRNVMFARRGVRVLPPLVGEALRFGTPEKGAPDIKNLYAYLKEFDGLCSSHTSATSMGTDWRDNDPNVEPIVEIIQGHRQNYEEPNAPQAPKGPDDSIQGYHRDGFVWYALAKGYRLGFQSSSDHVSTHVSYAVALAEEPTRAGLFDALKKRHAYAAQDNILLDVRCGEHLMGDEFSSRERPRLDINAYGTGPIARVDIIRQVGESMPVYVYNSSPKQAKIQLRWTDEAAERGKVHLYYVRIQQDDGKLAWASPIWVRYEP
ncbi:MAG: hypothetical protein IRY99_11260 [Isosphaeraceae bacterium]|nr:hypothetical protein [Isosphaeraceae bacterium]